MHFNGLSIQRRLSLAEPYPNVVPAYMNNLGHNCTGMI